ncbi:hypothetical protein ACFP2T_47475 [Plantactinospora solaniradicis]|uniref:Cyanate lyase C-terminal domain-containing protein n=1 Tax=Plantactinospora solaniradicis TaxID=1723736 RepID=A0ABW1KSZ1_9ACTN
MSLSEFGDGIMRAIDFQMDLTREPDPTGDRVRIELSGKYLPVQAVLESMGRQPTGPPRLCDRWVRAAMDDR